MSPSGRGGIEWPADGPFEIGPSDIGGGERVGELVFGIAEPSSRIEHFERGESAEAVAHRGNPIGFASGWNQLIAKEDRLAKRGVRRGVRGPNVEAHLRSEVLQAGVQLELVMP